MGGDKTELEARRGDATLNAGDALLVGRGKE